MFTDDGPPRGATSDEKGLMVVSETNPPESFVSPMLGPIYIVQAPVGRPRHVGGVESPSSAEGWGHGDLVSLYNLSNPHLLS